MITVGKCTMPMTSQLDQVTKNILLDNIIIIMLFSIPNFPKYNKCVGKKFNWYAYACFTGFIFHVPLVASSILHAGHISTLLTVATSNYFTYILCNYHEIFLLWIRVPAKTDCYNIASPGPKFWWEHAGVAWWALVSTFLVTTSSLRIITLECLLADLFATPCFHYYHLKRNYCACSSFERE